MEYCEHCLGLQYAGRETITNCVIEGMYNLQIELDNLVREGRKAEADSLVKVFEENYYSDWIEGEDTAAVRSWKEFKSGLGNE